MVGVVKQLTEFFKLQEQLAAHVSGRRRRSPETSTNPDQNQMEAALKRVMAMDQMAALEVTIRETMVYQSPPEMGALYSKVFEMRDVIAAEQEAARLAQEQRERRLKWQRHQRERSQNLTGGSRRPNLDPYRIPVDVVPVVETTEERLMGMLGLDCGSGVGGVDVARCWRSCTWTCWRPNMKASNRLKKWKS
jgi:hypothetical protein